MGVSVSFCMRASTYESSVMHVLMMVILLITMEMTKGCCSGRYWMIVRYGVDSDELVVMACVLLQVSRVPGFHASRKMDFGINASDMGAPSGWMKRVERSGAHPRREIKSCFCQCQPPAYAFVPSLYSREQQIMNHLQSHFHSPGSSSGRGVVHGAPTPLLRRVASAAQEPRPAPAPPEQLLASRIPSALALASREIVTSHPQRPTGALVAAGAPMFPSPMYSPWKPLPNPYRPHTTRASHAVTPEKSPSQAYSKPQKSPSQSYGSPSPSYKGPSRTPSPSYKVPPKSPSSSYKAPSSTPTPFYEVPPSPSYKVPPSTPSSQYKAPPKSPSSYLPPNSPPSPYEAPPTSPAPSYKRPPNTPSPLCMVPPNTASPSYKTPSSSPSALYKVPTRTPSPSYKVPQKSTSLTYKVPSSTPSPLYKGTVKHSITNLQDTIEYSIAII
ncbi:uncharacterized protein LOC134764359 [Penaeus indicus]|uniref:uncharacterized protein LOC134764359 n=1 Tax=Penaeus indicus TaxID=29960 RepID=UPI00300C0C03